MPSHSPLLSDRRSDGTVHLPNLLNRICVRPPYFNLQRLHLADGSLHAVAPAELKIPQERSPMSAAEMGRHAAIAGLCASALAQEDDTRRYYLAQRAQFTGCRAGSSRGEVGFRARLTHLDKRQADAQVAVTAGGAPLASLEVHYTVLTEAAFERLFRAKQSASVLTPGYAAELDGTLYKGRDEAVFDVPVISLDVCAGHFERYPALPVAVLMSYLTRLGGKLVRGPYRPVYGVVEANDLCWAGEGVRFEVERTRQDGSQHHFLGRAVSGGVVKGKMTFALEAVGIMKAGTEPGVVV